MSELRCFYQKSLPILEMYSGDALFAGGDLLLEKEIEEIMLELRKPFTEGMKDEEMESISRSAKKVEDIPLPKFLRWMKPMRRRLSRKS